MITVLHKRSPYYITLIVLAIGFLGFTVTHTKFQMKTSGKLESNHWRRLPLSILPEPGFEGTNSRDALQAVAFAVVPRWKAIKVHAILHALRLWGVRSDFSDVRFLDLHRQGILSGAEMLEVILDDRTHQIVLPSDSSILYRTGTGIGVRYGGDNPGPAHCDQLLQVVAELGLPGSTLVFPPGQGRGMLDDIIRDSLRNFLIDQELEFTTVAYSRYLPPTDRWTNRFGETTTFEDLTDALLRKPLGEGACNGAHVPYALANVLRASESYPIISLPTAKRIEERLQEIARLLENHQALSGGWVKDWAERAPEPESSNRKNFEAIWVTGHHLEWIALVPARVRPPRQVVMNAARFLAHVIPLHDFNTISHTRSYAAFSHAARALMLLEGMDAVDLCATGPSLGPSQ